MPDAVLTTPIPSSISKPKRRKLTLMDAEALAQLVIGDKMTEVEACLNLGIHNGQWRNWKDRHKHSATFETLCARLRGSEIQHSMRTIKACGDGIGMKQPDWRAHAFRLQVIAPERFSPQQQAPQQPASSVSDQAIQLLCDMARKVYGEISDATKPKQIGPIVEVESASTNEIKQVDASQ